MTKSIARIVPANETISHPHIEQLCDVSEFVGWGLYPLPIDITDKDVNAALERFDRTDPKLQRQIVATLIAGMMVLDIDLER